MVEDLIKRLREAAVRPDRFTFSEREHDLNAAADLIEQQAARLTALESERDEMIKALAECRDAMPIPEHGSPVEGYWLSAMGEPLEVPGYIDECYKALKSERDALLAAAGKEAVKCEPVAWAVYWGIGQMRPNSVHFEKQTAANVAAEIKSNTEIRPLYIAPTAALENGDGRDAESLPVTDEQVEAALAAFNEFPCPMNGCISRSGNAEQMRAAIDAALSQKAGE